MAEILTERVENVLRIQFNRPEKKNAMTSDMYSTVAALLNAAAKDDETRVVLLHGAGDAFCAGNDLGDFLHHPLKSDDSPQARFVSALLEFDKPLIAAVHGVAIGGGTTMLSHFDFVYAAEHTRFQMPFVNLALVPELGTSYRGGPHDNGSGHGTQTDTTAGRGRAREQAADEACFGRSNGGGCRTRASGVRVAFAVG